MGHVIWSVQDSCEIIITWVCQLPEMLSYLKDRFVDIQLWVQTFQSLTENRYLRFFSTC